MNTKSKLVFLAAFVLGISICLGLSQRSNSPTEITYIKKERYFNEGNNKTYLLLYKQNTDSLLRGKLVDKKEWDTVHLNEKLKQTPDPMTGVSIIVLGSILALFFIAVATVSMEKEEE